MYFISDSVVFFAILVSYMLLSLSMLQMVSSLSHGSYAPGQLHSCYRNLTFKEIISQNLQFHVTLLAEGEIQTILTACKNKNVNLELK